MEGAEKRRRLTLIAVPHDQINSRSYEISYRALRVLLGVGVALAVFLVIVVSSWFYMSAQALRVRSLERELAALEEEQQQVEELAEMLAEVEMQYERVRRLLGVENPRVDAPEIPIQPAQGELSRVGSGLARLDIPGSWPLVQTGFITQEASGEAGGPHPGIDIAVPQDSYIRAAAAGLVSAAGFDEIYGSYVLIEHADGYETMYGHASRLFVTSGDSVEMNEVVALSGSTGRSTAPHLHFEIRKDGKAIDPLPLLRKP